MNTYYIPHKLKIGDITHLADNDSAFAISQNLKVNDLIKIESPDRVFSAIVTEIYKKTIEVEIISELDQEKRIKNNSITIIQSVSGDKKYNFFLEKTTEIGVDRIIPLISSLSLKDKKQANKSLGLWEKIVADAKDQSRRAFPPTIDIPVSINKLKDLNLDEDIKICLTTENVECKKLRDFSFLKNKSVAVVVGPESGWTFKDLISLKDLGFEFVKMEGNILRTETSGIVILSIIKFLRNEI